MRIPLKRYERSFERDDPAQASAGEDLQAPVQKDITANPSVAITGLRRQKTDDRPDPENRASKNAPAMDLALPGKQPQALGGRQPQFTTRKKN